MRVDHEYLQGFGLGLQNLRATGQFCDAMVCVGSTKILVHKVVLSAASQKLHDLALEFDMTPHRERDQLEIIIPPDISLYAVNLFIQFLYTGQIEINSRIVGHVERLATLFEVNRLQIQCQEFIQENNPDSQNLESRVEPDSSKNGAHLTGREERLTSTPDDTSQGSNFSRSNSVCSAVSGDLGSGLSSVVVKTEPAHLASFEASQTNLSRPGLNVSRSLFTTSPILSSIQSKSPSAQNESSMSELEKLMSPVVNLQKLPSNITMDSVVMVSDDESDEPNQDQAPKRKPSQLTLEEKETIAIEAKRYGTTHIAKTKNIPLNDILSWMTLFGLRHPGNQRTVKHGKQVNYEADLAIVRWIVQQEELKGCVNLDSMKQYSLKVYQKTNPKFCASITWLGNFLQRNMSVLQGTKFVHGDKEDELQVYSSSTPSDVIVKQELSDSDTGNQGCTGETVLETIGEQLVLEDVPDIEQTLVNEAVEARLGMTSDHNMDDIDDNYEDVSFVDGQLDQTTEENLVRTDNANKPQMIQTPWGKRPIIIGQSKAFDAKSERKIVQWVLERQERDGYVFTDDFKNYARSLYKGSKVFGATQAWMKKFLRRHRTLKDVKFCSKFKNVYTTEEKVNSVALAKRFGVAYAAKHTGINQKVIHCWKLAFEKGMLNVDDAALMKIDSLSSSFSNQTMSNVADSAATSGTNESVSSLSSTPFDQAVRGMVPEFEHRIVQTILDLQAQEGSVNYSDISKISQSIYKETRPNFKASYNWVKSFLERHKEALVNIELENVSKVLVENDESLVNPSDSDAKLSNETISEMVDQALKVISSGDQSVEKPGIKSTPDRRPVVVGPSVTFDRKTEKRLVEWALEKHQADGYVFTDDFKLYAKSVHTGPKTFTASSGWMTLFQRRHRVLKDVVWRSKYKNNYSEEEKMAAVTEAKRLGAGHVGRKLGIEPKLICTWRIKMEKNAPKQQSFWKGTKIRKFGKGPMQPKYAPIRHSSKSFGGSDAARGIVPEFEHRIIDLMLEEHEKEGSISYEEMSRLAQSVYKETRPTFKASYAWIRNFMKRNEDRLTDLNIDNVKKVFQPEDEDESVNIGVTGNDLDDFNLQTIFKKRPIIVGQSRSLDTKTEKKLVQWTVEQQQQNGYVFLDQFKAFAQSLYKGEKKFAATQAWRIKFLRRNHTALKAVKFQSSFRNQYTLEEKKAIVLEAKKYGPAHVAKKTGIEHCLINAWKIKLERSGVIPPGSPGSHSVGTPSGSSDRPNFASKVKNMQENVGPGLYSYRGVVPAIEKKIVSLIMNKMDYQGSVSYQEVSNIARAVYKETRPHFKASYNWIKEFLKRNKKALRPVEFENTKIISTNSDLDMEVLIPEDQIGNIDELISAAEEENMAYDSNLNVEENAAIDENSEMDIVIDNPEDPNYDASGKNEFLLEKQETVDIEKIVGKRPIIIGKAVHFTRKTEKKIVEWLLEAQNRDGFVFTDDFRRYARSLYTGPPEKFGATNAWITKFLRRNRLEGQVEFQSKLKGNNAKFEAKIVELIQEQQVKEGSVSNEDIQRITQSVYKETRPNFRACYGWIKDFIKRNKDQLAGVELENVKKLYIPDEENGDGVIVQNYDPMKAVAFLEPSTSSVSNHNDDRSNHSFSDNQSRDSSWVDMDSSVDLDNSRSQFDKSQSNVLERLASQKRPIIIGPPRGMDSKTEKKLVQWMLEQQEQDGCVYLDLFKQYAKSIHSGPKKFAATQAWMVKFKQRNHEALKNVVIRSRFRNEYAMEEKMAIVEEAKRLGCNHVGRKLGINGGVIYSWKMQLEQLDKFGNTNGAYDAPDSSQPASARGVVPEFENAIVQMVLETQRAKGSVTYEDVSLCSRSVYKETRPNFKASNNWVMDFIRKYKEEFQEVKFENQRKFLTDDEKLHILSEEKKYGTEHVVKKRNISASTLYTWRRNMKAKSIPIPTYKAIVSSKIKKKYAKGKAMKVYTLEEKRNVVKVAEANGVTYASLKLGVTRNMIGKWIRYFRDQGENIVINYTHSSTMKKELELKIVSWVLEENEKLGIVLISRIIKEAKRVFEAAYTGFNATQHWLEGFLSQNSSKFENVRFRDSGDRNLDFSDEIKLKISRYSETHGAVATGDLTGLTTKIIYHWRRNMRLKGHDLATFELPPEEVKVESTSSNDEPKSCMQQKLDSIAAKYDLDTRKSLVLEATISGTSATVKKHKLPLPLLLKWMKLYGDDDDDESQHSVSMSSDDGFEGKMKVRLPSVEKKASSVSGANKKASKEHYKKLVVEEVNKFGVKNVCDRRGISSSTIYNWLKEHRESSEESNLASTERTSSVRSSLERESTTPIRIQDIKKEPGINEETSVKKSEEKPPTSTSHQPKTMRKYTLEEKQEVVKRASEIGQKKASIELGVPLSNVKRWFDLYRTPVNTTSPNPPVVSSPSSALPKSIMAPEVSTDTLRESGIERKRRLSDMMKSPKNLSPPNSCSKRMKYTEEEKVQFVKDTELLGTAPVAKKAMVSIDVVYQWRSKYLKVIKQSVSEGPNSSVAESRTRSSSPEMPAPRNSVLDLSSSHGRTMANSDETDSSHLAYLGLPVTSNRYEGFHSMKNATGYNDMDMEHEADGTVKSQPVENINDLDILAVDHILEMTSSYMEAEKKHKNDPFGIRDATDNNIAEDDDDDLPSIEDGEMDMIKIVDVKSQAANQ